MQLQHNSSQDQRLQLQFLTGSELQLLFGGVQNAAGRGVLVLILVLTQVQQGLTPEGLGRGGDVALGCGAVPEAGKGMSEV